MGYYTKKARLNIRKSIALCEDLLYEIDRCICHTDRYFSSSFFRFIATDKIFERINEFIFNRNIQIKKSKMCMKNGTTHTHTHTNTRTTSDKSLWYILFLYYHRYLKCIRSLKWKSLIITWYVRNRGNWIIGLVFPTHCRHLLSQIISRVEIFTIVARSTRDQIHINLF